LALILNFSNYIHFNHVDNYIKLNKTSPFNDTEM
jgi:hypothetical protein